jgi:hypothetical protein
MKVIVFPYNDAVALIWPTPEFEDQIEAVAQKDVPADTIYRIMDVKDLPSRETRDLWFWTEDGPLGIKEPVVIEAVAQ